MINRKQVTALKGEDLDALIRSVHSKGMPALVKARGTSMMPTIWPGDTLVIRSPGANKFCLGDVVSFLDSDCEFVVHRIIWKTDRSCFIKGDNIIGGIEHVDRNLLMGVVEEVIRFKHGSMKRKMISGFKADRYLWAALSLFNLIPPVVRLCALYDRFKNKSI